MSHMPGWHVPSMISVLTKYGEITLYGDGEIDIISKKNKETFFTTISFCTLPCQPTWQSSFSVNDSVKLIRQ